MKQPPPRLIHSYEDQFEVVQSPQCGCDGRVVVATRKLVPVEYE
jgi:hypothetical protein